MDKAIKLFPALLILFHAIGIGLFLYFATAPAMSFLNIFFTSILVVVAEKNWQKSVPIFVIIFSTGFLIELLGVQTGILFGSYAYGDSMGPLFMGTPLIIGSTWYAVVASSSAVAQRIEIPLLAKSLLAGFLAVLMDVMIEQVAMSYGLWSWEGGQIPFYNYVCWFIFGSIFSFIYLKYTNQKNNTAFYLFWIWAAFFTTLTIF